MKQKLTKLWLSCWLYVITLLAGVLFGLLAANWSTWDFGTKIYAFATALLPLHVLEEWRFPGGFHTMYNMMAKSDKLDRYPMNQLSDMWTNLIGILFGCVVLIVGVNPFFLMMQLMLCIGELQGHISEGVFVYKKFKEKGKKTIYNPGLFTTIFGYLPIAVCILIFFFKVRSPSVWQVLGGIVCGAILGGFAVKGMERICLNENSPYAYDWGNGYFEKYLK